MPPFRLRTNRSRENLVTDAFDIGVALKGIDGVLEIFGGFFLLLVPLEDIRRFLIWVTGKELSEDPKDFVATHLVHLANTLSIKGYELTIAYLLIHGFVKVFLVYMLLRRRLWAYPTAIAVFVAFGAPRGAHRARRHRHRAHLVGVQDPDQKSPGRRGNLGPVHPRLRSRTSIPALHADRWSPGARQQLSNKLMPTHAASSVPVK
jgi:uncharacterized membrane protein